MTCAAVECRTSERRGRLMIDAIVQVVGSILVSESGEMDDDIALS